MGTGGSPRSLLFHEVAGGVAHDVTERFHYLRSARTDGRAYGLSTPAGHLAALCTSRSVRMDANVGAAAGMSWR